MPDAATLRRVGHALMRPQCRTRTSQVCPSKHPDGYREALG